MWRVVLFLFLAGGGPLAGADLERRLIAAAKKGDEGELCALLGTVGPAPGKTTLRLLLNLGIEVRSPAVYAAVRRALAGIRDQGALDALGESLRPGKDFRPRCLALFALGDIPLPATVGLLLPYLKDKDERVRIRVAEALGQKPYRESVVALLGVLPAADQVAGEYSLVVRRALFRLTGMNFAGAEDWSKWWKTMEATWQPDSSMVESGRTVTAGVKPPGTFPQFFGVEIYSLRVVFVIDISESMSQPAKDLEISRMDLVKEELERLVRELRPETRFSIIAFNDKVRAHSKRLVAATARNKAAAIKFVRELTPRGYTWTQEALQRAFEFTEANTVVLLSDGSPFKKGFPPIPTQPIVEWVSFVNRFRRATVHCVGFPQAFVPFLRTLAMDNGGMYRHARRMRAPAGR